MKRRHVEVKVQPREDRATLGTKLDRDHRLPLAFRIRYAIVMAAFLTVAIAAAVAIRNTSKLDSLSHRVATDEHNTCVIQARGLPAGHDLAAAMADIHELLLLPSPQRPPPVVAVIIADLNGQLSAYLTLESRQPASRAC